MKLLSVIIPIYKVEPYIERCLRSLLNQDLSQKDYEIICVNDGSPDNCREIVKRLQKEFENIILIDQENKGVSIARNKGADEATGSYLLFVDPDDYVKENCLGSILRVVVSNNVQMAISGYAFLDSDGIIRDYRIFDKYEKTVYTGIEAYYLSREKKGITVDSSVGIIFETEFLRINSLAYVPHVILNQDVEFLARCHCLSDRCILINEILYFAVSRKGSATLSDQSQTERVRNGYILAAVNLKRFQKEQLLDKRQKIFLNSPIAKFVLLSVSSSFRTRSINKFLATVKRLRLSDLRKLNLEECSKFNRVCGKAYNLSPFLGAIVAFFYMKINSWHK